MYERVGRDADRAARQPVQASECCLRRKLDRNCELERLQNPDGDSLSHLADGVVDTEIDRVFLSQPEP